MVRLIMGYATLKLVGPLSDFIILSFLDSVNKRHFFNNQGML